MPTFIDTDNGLVNADHVARVTANQAARRGAMVYCFYGSDGAALGSHTTVVYFDLAELAAPVVAAAPGTVAVLITVISEIRGARPTPNDVWMERVLVVAWRLRYGGARPVLIEQPGSNGTVLIETPDGRLLSADDNAYSDLDAAKGTILADHQREWDRKHTPAATS